MVDFSVVGEILAETNLDEVGESIEESLEDAARASGEAAAGAEEMEEAMEDASVAISRVSGASDVLEEELEQVEDELEDVTQDSQAASSSVATLGATMASVDDIDADVNVDTDTARSQLTDFFDSGVADVDAEPILRDIDSPQSSTFLQQLASRSGGMDRPQGMAAAFGLERALEGDDTTLAGVASSITKMTDESVTYHDVVASLGDTLESSIAPVEALDETYDEMRDKVSGVDDAMREIPEEVVQSDAFTDSLIRQLDFEDEQRGPGALVSGLRNVEGDRTVAGLGRQISQMTVANDRMLDASRAVERAFPEVPGEGVETTSGLPVVADQFTDPVREGFTEAFDEFDDPLEGRGESARARVVPTDIPTGVPDDKIRTGELLPGEFTDTFSDFGELDTVTIDTSELDAIDRQKLINMGELPDGAISGIESDTIEISEVSAKELLADQISSDKGVLGDTGAGGVDALERNSENLAEVNESLDETKESFRRTSRELEDVKTETGEIGRTFQQEGGSDALRRIAETNIEEDRVSMGPQAGAISGPDILSRQGPSLRERFNFDELADASRKTSTALGFATASANLFTGTSKNAEEAVEDLDDEVEELGKSLAVVGAGFQNLSANLGPFNIGLSNLLVTIPILLAVLGPLAATLAGVAGAAVAIVAAFGALIGVGAIEFVEKLKQNFESIETTGDALEAVFKGLKEAFLDAIEPLTEVELGSLGPEGIFVTVLRDIITLVHMFSEAVASLLEMEVVEDFLLRMRAAILGFSEETEGGLSVIEGLKELMRGALPLLGDFLVWLIDVTPEFLAFVGTITRDAGPAIADLLQALIRLTVTLTEVGTGFFSVLLPALETVIIILTLVINVVKAFVDELGLLGDMLFALSVFSIAAVVGLAKLVTALETTIVVASLASNAFDLLEDIILKLNANLLILLKNVTLLAGGLLLMVAGAYLIADALGVAEPIINFLASGLGELVSIVSSVTGQLNNMGMIGEVAIRVLKLIAGLILLASGYLYFMSGALGVSNSSLLAFNTNLSIATLTTEGFTGAVYSAATSVSALQVAVTGGVLAGIIAMALGLKFIADNAGVLEAVIVGLIATFAALVSAVVLGSSLIASALIGTGIGAIIVGLGVAALVLANNWEEVTNVFNTGITAMISGLKDTYQWLQSLINLDGWWNIIANNITEGFETVVEWLGSKVQQFIDIIERATFGVVGDGDDKGSGGGRLSTLPARIAVRGIQAGRNALDSAASGGFVNQSGLAMVHSNEMIVPMDKLSANIDNGIETDRRGFGDTGSGGQTTQKININIDNSGSGTIDDRRAREIADITRRTMDNRRRREDGR